MGKELSYTNFISIRIRELYLKFKLACPSTHELKKEAKLAKAFMVLIKRKLTREQVCRSTLFRTLQSMAFSNVPVFLKKVKESSGEKVE